MNDFFKDLVFLGGTPIDSINFKTFSSFEYLSNQTESQRIIVNRSPESNRILHNETVRVFVKIIHGFTQ